MRLIYTDFNSIESDLKIALSAEQLIHLKRVLRLGSGDKIIATDGLGRICNAVLNFEGKGGALYFEEDPRLEQPKLRNSPRIIFEMPLVKPQTMDLMIQKATELGVSVIQPVVFSRSSLLKGERIDKITSRWNKIAIEAIQQSENPFLPLIKRPLNLLDLQASPNRWVMVERDRSGDSIQNCFSPSNISGANATTEMNIMIGPEGGLSESEIEFLRSSCAHFASLGEQILRVETAAIIALGIAKLT